jgi:hypothetical protein
VNFLPAPSSWEVCGVIVRVLTWASDEILEHFKQSMCKIHFWIAVDQSTIHVECGRWEEARRSIPAGGGFWMPSLAPLLDWLRGDFGASDFFCLGKSGSGCTSPGGRTLLRVGALHECARLEQNASDKLPQAGSRTFSGKTRP